MDINKYNDIINKYYNYDKNILIKNLTNLTKNCSPDFISNIVDYLISNNISYKNIKLIVLLYNTFRRNLYLIYICDLELKELNNDQDYDKDYNKLIGIFENCTCYITFMIAKNWILSLNKNHIFSKKAKDIVDMVEKIMEKNNNNLNIKERKLIGLELERVIFNRLDGDYHNLLPVSDRKILVEDILEIIDFIEMNDFVFDINILKNKCPELGDFGRSMFDIIMETSLKIDNMSTLIERNLMIFKLNEINVLLDDPDYDKIGRSDKRILIQNIGRIFAYVKKMNKDDGQKIYKLVG
jgi:hypothetical protein